jgi:hypothetical protein
MTRKSASTGTSRKHDWTSHTADAFRYLAMAWREIVPQPLKPEGRDSRHRRIAKTIKSR